MIHKRLPSVVFGDPRFPAIVDLTFGHHFSRGEARLQQDDCSLDKWDHLALQPTNPRENCRLLRVWLGPLVKYHAVTLSKDPR